MTTYEQPPNSKEQQVQDKARFMKMVANSMRALNENTETQTTSDAEGRPIIKTLVDDVQVRGGEARISLQVKPSEDPKHPNQPVTFITVANKFDSYSPGHPDIKLVPVTKLEYFADGHLGVYYGDSIEDIEKAEQNYLNGIKEDENERPLDVSYFEIDLETMIHDDNADGSPYDDWDHIEHIEDAVEALLMK
jgi:hypothetical protein